ncbi:PAS domain S-box protein [Mucilaginibacter lutimaris]|uniref:histidine kinase n=1 Tax=Mucilaginibacter lutimaris TaxID=931629 RepID=A0ABW2ZH60_9SPHI
MQEYSELFDFSPVPMWVYDIRDLSILAANKAACKDYGYTAEEFTSLTVEVLWPEEDKAKMLSVTAERISKTVTDQLIVRHITRSGKILEVEITSQPYKAWHDNARVIMALDVTDKLHAIRAAKLVGEFDMLERNILALNSKDDTSTRQVLTTYLAGIESLFPQLACCVMRVKNNKIYHWASASLPLNIINEFDNVEINEHAGSCGTAAYLKEKVIVTNVITDARWEQYKEVAVNAGYLSCWSYPLIGSDQQVMATFAIYNRKTGGPSELEQMIIARATGLLTILLEVRLYAEMLEETHKLMGQGQELAQFGNWSWDIVDNLVSWSDTLYDIYGIKRSAFEANFEGYLKMLHPADRGRVTEIIYGVMQSRNDVEFEERIIRPGGELRYLSSWATLKCDEEGRPVKMIGACLDISDWKKHERQLQKSNDRYEYISKASKDAVFDVDLTEDHISWGDGFLRVFGYNVGERKFSLQEWAQLVHPDDGAYISADLQRALNDRKRMSWTREYRLKHLDGYYLQVEATGYILRNKKGTATQMIGVVRDITERYETARALAASEKRYSDLFHMSPLPMWVYDIDTYRFLDVNKAAVKVYGYTKEEFLSMTIMGIRPKEDIKVVTGHLKNNIRPGRYYSSMARHLKKNGEIMLVNANGNSISYNDRPARMIVVVDITEKVRAREALEKSERRFKQLIQEGSDLIAILSEEGKLKYVSPTAERILGVDVEELIGQEGISFIHTNDIYEVKRGFAQLEYFKRVELAPFRIFNSRQQVLWMETIITDMRDDETVGGIIINARDVTQRVLSEWQNKEMLERYNIVAKATSDTIWDCNLQNNEVNWNHGIKNMFGYEHPAGTFSWWQEHVHPDDLKKITDLVEAKKQSGEERWSSEYRFRCADGSYKFVFDRGFLLFDSSGRPVRMIGAMQDITERMNYIREMEENNKKLMDIAWTQAHLVRGPLSRILGISDLLRSGDNDPETSARLLEYLTMSAEELDKIVKTIIEKGE